MERYPRVGELGVAHPKHFPRQYWLPRHQTLFGDVLRGETEFRMEWYPRGGGAWRRPPANISLVTTGVPPFAIRIPHTPNCPASPRASTTPSTFCATTPAPPAPSSSLRCLPRLSSFLRHRRPGRNTSLSEA